jgi:hypothetical protein
MRRLLDLPFLPFAAAATFAIVIGVVACGSDDPTVPGEPVESKEADDLEFYEVTHADGTRYRCIYTYQSSGYHGGPAMWCERLPDLG